MPPVYRLNLSRTTRVLQELLLEELRRPVVLFRASRPFLPLSQGFTYESILLALMNDELYSHLQSFLKA